jgi:clan AA aspartic protease
MMTGTVNQFLEATIQIAIRDANGREHSVHAIVDTGFSGSLTLPFETIAQLGLPWRSRGSAMLADGSFDQFDNFTAVVIWDGRPREILVEGVAVDPLIGVGLLAGFEFRMQTVSGGAVTIEPIV